MTLVRSLICLLVLCSLPVGCGESTQEKMMRIAQERAVRNRADKAEEEANAAAAKQNLPAATKAEETKPEPPEPAAKEPEKPGPAKSASEPEKATAPAAKPPAANPPTKPSTTDAEDAKPKSLAVPLSPELANLPARDQLLAFSRYGETVAYTGASQSIGIFDVETKRLVRQVFNPEITPFAMSMNEDSSRLVVGGIGGTFKVFPLNQQEGLDRFQQSRQQRRDAASPRKGHQGPVTATAINRAGNLVATAGSDGTVKLWSNTLEDPLRLTSDASSFVAVKSYQDDQLVLGATTDNRLLFWPVGKKLLDAREFPDGQLSASPTCLISGDQDKGILVGDASGQVSMWLASGEQLVHSRFQAHREPIIGLGLIDSGNTLLTATKGGELFRWSLPIAPQTEIKTLEPTALMVVSERDDAVGVLSRSRNLDLYSMADGKPVRRHTLSGSRGTLTAAAFSSDGEVLALADDQGRIDFQTRTKKMIAVTQTGGAAITQMATSARKTRSSRSRSKLAFATEDGKVRVSAFPQINGSRISTVAGKIAASSESGTESIVARGNQLTYLRNSQSGPTQTLGSTRLPSGEVTAVFVDSGLALIGTSAGEVWSWQCSMPNSTPTKTKIKDTGNPVLAVSLSAGGQIWMCDAAGSSHVAAFAGRNDASKSSPANKRGKASANLKKAESSETAGVIALNQAGDAFIGKELSSTTIKLDDGPFSDVSASSAGFAALKQNQTTIVRRPSGDGAASNARNAGVGTVLVLDDRAIVSLSGGSDVTAFVDDQNQGTAIGAFESPNVIDFNGGAEMTHALQASAQETAIAKSSGKWLRMVGQESEEITLPGDAIPLAISSNADKLVIGSASGMALYDVASPMPQLISKLPESLVGATAVAFDEPGNRMILSVGDAAESQRIVSVALADAANLATTQVQELVTGKAPVSKIVTLNNRGFAVLDANAGVQVYGSDGGEAGFQSGDSKFSDITAAGQVLLLVSDTGKLSRLGPSDSQPVPIELPLAGRINRVAAIIGNASTGDQADERIVVTTDQGEFVTINASYSVATIESIAELQGSKLLSLSGYPGGIVRGFMAKGELVRLFAPPVSVVSNVRSSAVCDDGSLVAFAENGNRLRILRHVKNEDSVGGTLVAQELPALPADLVGLADLPRKSQFVVAMQDGSTARIAPGQRNANVLVKSPSVGSTQPQAWSSDTWASGATIIPRSAIEVLVRPSLGAAETGNVLAVNFETKRSSPAMSQTVASFGTGLPVLAFEGGQPQFQVVRADGSLKSLTSNAARPTNGQFQIEGKIQSAAIYGETLAVQLEQKVSLFSAAGQKFGKKLADLQSGNVAITAMAGNPEGDRIATCDRIGQLAIWDAAGKSLMRSQLPIQAVDHLLFSSGGTQLVVADAKRLIVLDATSGLIETQLSLSQPIQDLIAWNSETVRFLAGDGSFQSMSIPASEWVAELDGRPSGLAWTSDGSRLVAISQTGQFLEMDAISGAEIRRINLGTVGLQQIVTLANGREFAVLNDDSDIFIVPPEGSPVELSNRSAFGLKAIAVDDGPQWLYAVNDLGEVVAYDLTTPDQSVQTIPCQINVGMIHPVGGTRFVVASKTQPRLSVIDGAARRDQVDRTSSRIEDIGFLPDGSFAVIADATRRLKMIPLGKGDPRSLDAGDMNVQKVAVHPTGVRVAGLGAQTSAGDAALLIWDTVTLELKSTVPLSGKTVGIVYSHDGGSIAVSFTDGRCEVYDGASGELLEAMPAVEGLSSVAFASDNSRLLLAHAEGTVTVQPISVLGKAKASNDPVISLSFHGADRYLLAATMKGEVSLWNRAAMKSPQARFQGVDASVRYATISADGQFALAVYEDDKNSTAVWKTSAINGATVPIAPHLVVSNSVPSTAANFTSDSKFLIVGGSDGLIRAWSLDENREIARFKGHAGSIASIAPLKEKGRFVSGGADRSIRSWRFPSSLPSPGAEVPEGGLSDTTEVRDLEPPRLNNDDDEEDPWDAARQALIAGTGDTANAIGVLDLIEGNEAAKSLAKSSLNKILTMENTNNSTAEALSEERRRLAKSRREIVDTEMAKIQATYSGGFSNLYFAASTNFKFGLEKTFRPVELLFSDRFLYAARPSSAEPERRKVGRYRNVQAVRDTESKKTNYDGYALDSKGNPIYDKKGEDSIDGDNGALLSWDYRYSQLQAHAWSIEDLKVKELYALPKSAGVFSAPQMMLFNQDGSSRKFSTAETWTTTDWNDNEKQYLAIGTAGGNRVESDILKLFNISGLVDEAVRPVSQYRSFEGIITAMAFANNHSNIAFAVRERSVHRLFVADIDTMQLELIEEVRHSLPWIEEKDGRVTRVSDAAPGITTLAFSPDDGLLIAHGKYAKKTYRFTGWKLNDELKPALLKPQFHVEDDKEPFFDSIGSKSVWFINSDRYGRQDRDPSNSRVKKVVVRRKGGFSIINLANGGIERDIKYLPTQHRQPIFDISQNGRWIMMGDDTGMAYIWDAITGEQFSVTIDESTEQQIKASERTPSDLPERPAHTGPIVGVAMSEPDPGKEYPAFAATFGEENRVKVWELFPIIELQSQPLRARETTTASTR